MNKKLFVIMGPLLLFLSMSNLSAQEAKLLPNFTAVPFDSSVPPPDFVPVEKEPQIIQQSTPKYPAEAIKDKIEGRVWVKIWIDKDGMPHQAVILKSDAQIFDEPSVQAAMKYRFTPAIMNKKPVAVWVVIPFTFKLMEEDASRRPLWGLYTLSPDSIMIGECEKVARAAAGLRTDFRSFSRDSLAGWSPKDNEEYNEVVLVYHAIPTCEEILRQAQRSILEAQKYLEQAKAVIRKNGKEWRKVK